MSSALLRSYSYCPSAATQAGWPRAGWCCLLCRCFRTSRCCLSCWSCPARANIHRGSWRQWESTDVWQYLLTLCSWLFLSCNPIGSTESTSVAPQYYSSTADSTAPTSLLTDNNNSYFQTSTLGYKQERSQPQTQLSNTVTRGTTLGITRSRGKSRPHLACFHNRFMEYNICICFLCILIAVSWY